MCMQRSMNSEFQQAGQIVNGVYTPPTNAPEAEDGGPVPDGPYDQDRFGFFGVTPDGYIVADARAATWLLNRMHRGEGLTVIMILPDRGDDVAWVTYESSDLPTRAQEQAAIRAHRRLIRNDPRRRTWVTNPRRRDVEGRPICPTQPKDPDLAAQLWYAAAFPISVGWSHHLARAMMKILGAVHVVRGTAS